MNLREQEIMLLLRDYMNILPPGPQEAFVPIGSGVGTNNGWPLSDESIERLDEGTEVGYTYKLLDKALICLEDEYPNLYSAILQSYLHEGAGHRDVDHWRNKILTTGSPALTDLVERHDKAIILLAEYLQNDRLYVRWPQKAPGPKPSQNMEERHDELFAIFLRNIDSGTPYRQSIKNATFKMVDNDGEPYYSARHAERIIKPRWVEHNENH